MTPGLLMYACRQRLRALCRKVCESFGSDAFSHLALYDLDRKLKKYLDFEGGAFIEAGGNDGLAQSNTYWFERFRNWRGVLIEALPWQAQRCRQNRPNAHVISAALVADENTKFVHIVDADLMTYVPGGRNAEEETLHHANALNSQALSATSEIEVPAMTLAKIIQDSGINRPFDLFSLDVEGYEIPVLQGMNPARHRPRYILVETNNLPGVLEVLGGHYKKIDQFSFHDYLLVTDSPL
jgi:FkbM family methyltransferase